MVRGSARRKDTINEVVSKTDLDEEVIERVVRSFYTEVRKDPLLGPIFESRIVDWEPHLARMCAFWSSVALMTGRYHGQPMRAHLPLPIDAAHFDRWLELFCDTARRLCTPAGARHLEERARRIAESLELGLANQAGVLLAPGQRFHHPQPEEAHHAR